MNRLLITPLILAVALLTPLSLTPRSAEAQTIPRRPSMITPEAEKSIQKGLQWLKANQNRDGSWDARGSRYSVAMTSLSGLALMASGSTPVEGEYAPNIRRAVEYVLKCADRNTGLISRQGEGHSVMHEHGFAMLFLGQVYGMERNPKQQEKIRAVLEKAVKLTARSQNNKGGWLYTPNSGGDEGSITVTQIQGLRAIRNAGIKVPKATVDKAAKYIELSQQKDGGIAYRAGMSGSRPAISAAAVAVLYNAGRYEHPSAEKCLNYIIKIMGMQGGRKPKNISRVYGGHKFYALLYAGQAMYLSSEKNWKAFFPTVRDDLIRTQQGDGAWMGDHVGHSYGTAIALLTLQLEYRHLPILQR